MRIPRDLTGQELSRQLKRYGYQVTRQTGSHIRLTTTLNGEHHITIPNHNPLRIGTLNNILKDVAHYLGIERDKLLADLFEND